MNSFKKINNVRLIIYSLVLLAFFVWSYFSYLEIHNPSVSEGSYKVCVSSAESYCPSDAHFIACSSTIFQWANDICKQYRLKTVYEDELQGKCGTKIISLTCQ